MGKYSAVLVYLGEPGKALETVQKAMRINPFCPDDLFEDEGMCHFWLGDYERAVESFRKIKTPNMASPFYLSMALHKTGDLKKSAELLQKAFNISGKSIDEFLEKQHYQDPERKKLLREILESIPKGN